MKQLLHSGAITVFFALLCLSATAQTTLRAQMTQVNAEWQQKPEAWAATAAEDFADDNARIRRHLQLVEQYLRSQPTTHLPEAQQQHRNHYLAVLHRYWKTGLFPTNTHHRARTPYFIDEKGVACAVGQLLVASGASDLAHQIQQNDNYDYIATLQNKYPAIKVWAADNGFTTDELAWIQPGYCFNPIPCGSINRNPTCYGSSNGCIAKPDTAFSVVVTYAIEQWSGGSWIDLTNMIGGAGNGCLNAGNYRWKLTDPTNNAHYFYRQLDNPPPIVVNFTTTPDIGGGCNGSATALSLSGTLTYQWLQSGSTAPVLSDVCGGAYDLLVQDINGCAASFSVLVPTLTAVTSIAAKEKTVLFPNPAKTQLTIQQASARPTTATITDIYGRVVFAQTFTHSLTVPVAGWSAGVYLLKTDEGDCLKFVKE